MENSVFPDLEGSFEVLDEEEPNNLIGSHRVYRESIPYPGSIQPAIAEQKSRKNYWNLRFRRVQYGTFREIPVCLIVIESVFHPEDRRRHRFTWARIKIEFKGEQDPIEMLKVLPEMARGITVPETHSSYWNIRPTVSLSMAGSPASVYFSIGDFGHSKQYPVDRTASMQGSGQGFPIATAAVWTVEEANSEGIPGRIPPLVVLARCSPGTRFEAHFKIDAKIGFSMNPSRLFAAAPRPVKFDGKSQLILHGEEKDPDFSSLDLNEFTKLDFSGDQ